MNSTRYPDAIALKSAYSHQVAEALAIVFSKFGIPEENLTYCSSNLIGKLMRHFYGMLGVLNLSIPSSDGWYVGAFHGNLKQMLRKMPEHFRDEWNKAIPYLFFSYREAPQEEVGFAPFELNV